MEGRSIPVMTSAQKLHALIDALRPGQSTWVEAKTIGASAPGFHAIVQSWMRHGGGHGFELVGEPHKDSGAGLYDKVRTEFRSLDTSACPIDSHPTTRHSAAWLSPRRVSVRVTTPWSPSTSESGRSA